MASKASLEELKTIIKEIMEIKGDPEKEQYPIMLVGNKADDEKREVLEKFGAALAKQWKCAFMETSAKSNTNVQELFQELLQMEKRRTMSLFPQDKKGSRGKELMKKCVVM